MIRSTLAAAVGAMALAAGISPLAIGKTPSRLPRCDASLMAFKPDRLTTVVAVRQFRKGDPLVVSEPVTPSTPRAASDLCMVKLMVGPGNPGPADAPSTSQGIGIEVFLPNAEAWTGRIHNIGGTGGFDGGEQGNPGVVGWPYAAANAGTEGTVSASTDAGHSVRSHAAFMNPDGTPARQIWLDFSHRAQHEVALKTKALALAFYGQPAKYAYYEGISTGGRHGYQLAQKYPGDYDGIIASLPTIDYAQWATYNFYKGFSNYRDTGTALTWDQQDLVSNAAIGACDMVGGQHLGFILDNAACKYDPTRDPKVLCRAAGGQNDTPACVTKAQATLINKWWYGITRDGSVPDPAVENGAGVALNGKHRWYGMMRGTSLYQGYFSRYNAEMMRLLQQGDGAAGSAQSAATSTDSGFVALALQNPTLGPPSFKNASGNGQNLWTQLSYELVSNAFDRGIALDPVFAEVSSANPDLSAFKAGGGKFLSYHGWNDESIPVQQTMRYYDEVMEKMGGAAQVQSFYKLFLIPGGGHGSPHGTANPAANPPTIAAGQLFQLMIDWVEKGVEPKNVTIQSPKPEGRMVHPLCAYPAKTTYVGGEPTVASSFKCS